MQYALPAEVVAPEAGSLRGHGTRVKDSNLVSTVSGVVERINRLVLVVPVKGRFFGEVGDIVVGQIVEVNHAQRLWRVDVNARHYAQMHLSAIILPGSVQRKRTAEDTLNMRSFYEEGDLVSAELQQIRGDGVPVLRTRSVKYGKLVGGIAVRVYSALVKRLRSHFVDFPCGVSAILGLNGYIWLYETPRVSADGSAATLEDAFMLPLALPQADAPRVRPEETTAGRLAVAQVRNSILVLNTLFLPISPESIMGVYRAADALGVPAKDMLSGGPDAMQRLARLHE